MSCALHWLKSCDWDVARTPKKKDGQVFLEFVGWMKKEHGEIINFFTFSEDQSGTVCPLGDVFEPLRAVVQCKHGRHVGEQSLGGRGQMRTTLFLIGEKTNQSCSLYSYLCRANVAGRLVPANVLLSCLQSQSIHLLTGCIPEKWTNLSFRLPFILKIQPESAAKDTQRTHTWWLRPSDRASCAPGCLWRRRRRREVLRSRAGPRTSERCPARCPRRTPPEDAARREPAGPRHSRPAPGRHAGHEKIVLTLVRVRKGVNTPMRSQGAPMKIDEMTCSHMFLGVFLIFFWTFWCESSLCWSLCQRTIKTKKINVKSDQSKNTAGTWVNNTAINLKMLLSQRAKTSLGRSSGGEAPLSSSSSLLGWAEPLPTHSHPSFVSPVHQSGEVLHPTVSVRVLEEHARHIFPTEVHLMGQLQHRLHSNVAARKSFFALFVNFIGLKVSTHTIRFMSFILMTILIALLWSNLSSV